MIQSLPNRGSEWLLYWIELSEPVETPEGFILPTLLVLGNAAGIPLAPPELLAELDQMRAEQFLARQIETLGRPDLLVVFSAQEWEEQGWKNFASEQSISLRIQKTGHPEAASILEVVKAASERPDGGQQAAERAARGLLESAFRLNSARRREDYLRKAVELDSSLSLARVEIADLEFGRRKWKKCLAAYQQTAQRELPAWSGREAVEWWENPDTRPLLRAIYGAAMTLWHQGKHPDAARQFARLLEINPTDHQGARFFLPLLWLLADEPDEAAEFFRAYEKNYTGDFADPALLFAWGLSLHREGEELAARSKYRLGIIKNIYLAPMLLEAAEPPTALWFPTDRSEPAYAEEFVDSYATLWDRDPGALRPVREVWEEMQPQIERLVAHRRRMLDFQDQRYDPAYRQKWEALVGGEERLTKL